MNSFQLTCFLTVAETLSFARSAERLSVTQPAVTHQIRSLETELGVTLFNRNTHSVELTKAGYMLIDDARTMVNTSLRIQKRFENMQEQEFPELRIGCHSDGYLLNLSEILREFSKVYPDVHVSIRMAASQSHLYRMLEEDKVDIVLALRENQDKKNGKWTYKELTKTPVVCICAADHPYSAYPSVNRGNLDQTKLIIYEPTKASFFSAQIWSELMSGRKPEDLYFCESASAAIMLAEAGYGIFPMPEIFIPDYPASLTAVPMEGIENISFGMYYISLKISVHLDVFCKLLQKYFSQIY